MYNFDLGQDFYLALALIKGQLATKTEIDDDDYKETLYNEDYIVTEIEAGGDEIFGEVSLIDQGQKNSTIKAIKQCKILKINHKDLFDFMNKNPSIGYKVLFVILENCIKYLRKADKDVVSLFNALVEVVEND